MAEVMFFILVTCVFLAGMSAAAGLTSTNLQQDLDGRNRIINGNQAVQGEFPSQVALLNWGTYICGASILNEEWVLTAASCVISASIAGLSVRSGSINRLEGTDHKTTTIILHPNFIEWGNRANDIAVVRVFPLFTFDRLHRQALNLPVPNTIPATSSIATVVGWGYPQESGPNGTPVEILRKANIHVSDQTACKSFYYKDGFDLTNTQLCADVPQGGLGSCHRDQGGPMFVDGVAVGIISWGEGCAPRFFNYSVFTRVSAYIGWINCTIGPATACNGSGSMLKLNRVQVFTLFYLALRFLL